MGLMTKGMLWRVLYQGVMIGAIPLVAYITGLREGGEALGRTMAFSTLIFAQLVHIRNLHSNKLSSDNYALKESHHIAKNICCTNPCELLINKYITLIINMLINNVSVLWREKNGL